MNRERAKELLAVMQAFVDHEEIQYKEHDSDWVTYSGSNPALETMFYKWRIKPEPFECWVNLSDRGFYYAYDTEGEALGSRSEGKRTIHMREVT